MPSSSGVYSFNPALSDIVLEAFSRVQVRPTSLTSAHMLDARMSAQYILSTWATKPSVPNLWKIELFSVPLTQGVATYAVPSNVVAILDYFLRLPVTVSTVSLTNPFSTTAGSTTVNVSQTNHGLAAGSFINLPSSVSVGGITLSGLYAVNDAIDADNYQILALDVATSTATGGGTVTIQEQGQGNGAVDYVLTPLSRTDYAAQPEKETQARPTTVWWDRQINSKITTWPVADGSGPYVLYYYAMTQIQDAALPNGMTLDIPYRFLAAFAAALAAALAEKYPPPPPNNIQRLETKAEALWQWAANQDTENVPTMISPGLESYFW